MDRHVKWLRRRIVASVATQTAATFAIIAVLSFVVMFRWTSEGPLTALFGSVVIAQLVALARVGHAMRRNPLNHVFMRNLVERPFSYRVTRFQGEDAHPVAARLPGFAPVATIRDCAADAQPVFDVYHDPSRLVAASVNRASGSIALISSLADGRVLVTAARMRPPHERLVMSLADDDGVESVISTHRRAFSSRTDVVELRSSAHQVVIDSLALEYDSYLALGPALSPFIDLDRRGHALLRLIARVRPEELTELPARLGPAHRLPAARSAPPDPATANAAPAPLVVPDVAAPDVVSPRVVSPLIDAPQVALPQIVAAAPAPVLAAAEAVMIGPSTLVTRDPDDPDVERVGEPPTADVPVVMFDEPPLAPIAPTEPLDLLAVLASLSTRSAPADGTFALLTSPTEQDLFPAPSTLAEAIVGAPDTAAALLDDVVDDWPIAVVAQTGGHPSLGPDLSAALGYNDVEAMASRPRLSAALRANAAPRDARPLAKRTRHKPR